MSLATASILSGATVTPSGGTALAFEGEGIQNGSHLIFASDDTDYRTRREIVCSPKKPKPLSTAPNGFTQSRNTVVIKLPLTLDNGLVTTQTWTISQSVDVESTDAENQEGRAIAAQVLVDSDFAAFWDDSALG